MRPSTGHRIGIDLGGTKTEAIVIDGDGNEVFRRRVSTPSGNYDGIIDAIARLIDAIPLAVNRKTPVGVGIPGTISPATGVVKNANSTVLIGHTLDQDLANALGREVRLANDADCFALSEALDGAGQGSPIVFGAIIGTGVGGGLVVNNHIVRGPNAITGEWGHNPLPWPRSVAGELPGDACYCGKLGCIETFLSGPSLARAYAKTAGKTADAAMIAARDLAGDADAARVLDAYIDQLARGLATVINTVDPHVVVLGGGVSNIRRLYRSLPQALARYVFSDTVVTRILPPHHGDSSGVRGAAWLWT